MWFNDIVRRCFYKGEDVKREAEECCGFVVFKQKTAYEMLRSLVGSEMCIRDRYYSVL